MFTGEQQIAETRRAAEQLCERFGVRPPMNGRYFAVQLGAHMQLRLQQTVEGLSVLAISYYFTGILGYIAKPLSHVIAIDATVLQGVSVPLWWCSSGGLSGASGVRTMRPR
jgi:uncharacterized membrane-anchored protein